MDFTPPSVELPGVLLHPSPFSSPTPLHALRQCAGHSRLLFAYHFAP